MVPGVRVFAPMERKTIALGTYGGDTWYQDHSACVLALRQQFGVELLAMCGCIYIAIARSVLATGALEQGADAVVFIDHDVIFDPADVLTIADEARECQGVVAAPYSMRKMGAGVVGGFGEDTGEIVFGDGGSLYRVSGNVGMGFTAIHRSVFERIAAENKLQMQLTNYGSCVPYFEQIQRNGHWFMEDSSFCCRARDVGVKFFTDTRIRILHRGTHDFSVADAAKKHADVPTTVRLRTK